MPNGLPPIQIIVPPNGADAVTAVFTVISAVATVVLAVCAVVALWYAWGQLKALVEANQAAANASKEAAKTERARFLFNVDEMFENVHFTLSRTAFIEASEEIREQVETEHENKPKSEQHRIQGERFSEFLFELKRTNLRRYTRILKLCGFFETLHILITAGYVEEEKVFDLYEPAILRLAMATKTHIKKRQELDPYIDGNFMENFLKLAGRAQEAATRRASSQG